MAKLDLELADYLDEDDGVIALCKWCADKEGLTAFAVGVALNTDQCEMCGLRQKEGGDDVEDKSDPEEKELPKEEH